MAGSEWGTQGLNPENVPYYGRLSQAIGRIPPQQFANTVSGVSAVGEALKDFGNMVTGTTKYLSNLADMGLKVQAENTASQIEAQNQGEVARLTKIRDQLYGSKAKGLSISPGGDEGGEVKSDEGDPAIPAGPPSTSGDLTPLPNNRQFASLDTKQELPPEGKSAVKQVEALQSIRDSKGMPDTQYMAMKNKILFDARSQIPLGLRDKFDSDVAEATHARGTANSTIRQLTSDINKYYTAVQKENEKIMTKAMSNIGDPAVATAYSCFRAGKCAIDDVFIATQRAEQKELALKTKEKELDLAAKQAAATGRAREEDKYQAKYAMNQWSSTQLPTHMNNLFINAGVPEDVRKQGPKASYDWIVARGPQFLDQFKMSVAQDMDSIQAEATQRFSKPGENGGPSLLTRLGEDYKVPLDWHKSVLADLDSKEHSPIHANARLVGMIHDSIGLAMATGPDQDAAIRFGVLSNLTKQLGPNAAQFLDPQALRTLSGSLGTPAYMDHIKSMLPGNGNILNDLSRFTASGRALGIPEPQLKQGVDAYVNNASNNVQSPDLDAQSKENVVKYTYGSASNGLITHAAENGPEYFDKLYNPNITQAVHDTSPKAWQVYSDSFRSTFANDVAVPVTQKLSDALNHPELYSPQLFIGPRNPKQKHDVPALTFNNDPKSGTPFNYNYGGETAVLGTKKGNPLMDEQLDQLNRAWTSAKAFAETSGMDPIAYFAGVLKNLGIDNSATKQLLTAIGGTKKQEQKEEQEAAKKAEGKAEE